MASRFALDRSQAVVLIIDVQERLGAAMPQPGFERLVKNSGLLVEAARTLALPLLVTEQYPKGLGPTLPVLRDALPPEAAPIAKVVFSSQAVPEVAEKLHVTGRRQVVIAGMETHVCVFQTVRDLIGAGYQPFVVRDAVLSRTSENHETGLALMREAGATITSTETVIFDLLGQAGTPEFKKLSPLLK